MDFNTYKSHLNNHQLNLTSKPNSQLNPSSNQQNNSQTASQNTKNVPLNRYQKIIQDSQFKDIKVDFLSKDQVDKDFKEFDDAVDLANGMFLYYTDQNPQQSNLKFSQLGNQWEQNQNLKAQAQNLLPKDVYKVKKHEEPIGTLNENKLAKNLLQHQALKQDNMEYYKNCEKDQYEDYLSLLDLKKEITQQENQEFNEESEISNEFWEELEDERARERNKHIDDIMNGLEIKENILHPNGKPWTIKDCLETYNLRRKRRRQQHEGYEDEPLPKRVQQEIERIKLENKTKIIKIRKLANEQMRNIKLLSKQKARSLVEGTINSLNQSFQQDVALLIDKYYDLKNILFLKEQEISSLRAVINRQEVEISQKNTNLLNIPLMLTEKEWEYILLENPKELNEDTLSELLESFEANKIKGRRNENEYLKDIPPYISKPFSLYGAYTNLNINQKCNIVESKLIKYYKEKFFQAQEHLDQVQQQMDGLISLNCLYSSQNSKMQEDLDKQSKQITKLKSEKNQAQADRDQKIQQMREQLDKEKQELINKNKAEVKLLLDELKLNDMIKDQNEEKVIKLTDELRIVKQILRTPRLHFKYLEQSEFEGIAEQVENLKLITKGRDSSKQMNKSCGQIKRTEVIQIKNNPQSSKILEQSTSNDYHQQFIFRKPTCRSQVTSPTQMTRGLNGYQSKNNNLFSNSNLGGCQKSQSNQSSITDLKRLSESGQYDLNDYVISPISIRCQTGKLQKRKKSGQKQIEALLSPSHPNISQNKKENENQMNQSLIENTLKTKYFHQKSNSHNYSQALIESAQTSSAYLNQIKFKKRSQLEILP